MVESNAPSTTRRQAGGFAAPPFRALQDEMNRMFQAFGAPAPWGAPLEPLSGAMGLRVDIAESETEIEIRADLPGLTAEDVEVTLEGDLLRIRATRESATEDARKTWRVTERSYGVFERAIRVPEGIDPETVRAGFDRGVLTIVLPRPAAKASAARRIAVGRAA